MEAAAAEFQEAGFDGATTAAIAKRAEVTEAQIFRYHASKQDLFRAAIFIPLNRHFLDFQSRLAAGSTSGSTGKELAHEYIGELQDFISKHSRMFLSFLVANIYSPESVGSIEGFDGLQAYFEKGKNLTSVRSGDQPKVSPELMVRVSFASVLANLMFKDWLFPKGLASDAEIRQAVADFVIEGISANEGIV